MCMCRPEVRTPCCGSKECGHPETCFCSKSEAKQPMREGARVKWITASGVHGSGIVLADEHGGHVPVAVDSPQGEEHRVIWCTVTWLTEEK